MVGAPAMSAASSWCCAAALNCSAKRALRSTAASSRPSTRGIGTSPRPRCTAVWRRLTRALPLSLAARQRRSSGGGGTGGQVHPAHREDCKRLRQSQDSVYRAFPSLRLETFSSTFAGDPFVGDGGLEFLFGYLYLEPDGSDRCVGDWVLNRQEERAAFERFIDFVTHRLTFTRTCISVISPPTS